MQPRIGYVYILASRRNGTLYIGVTSRLLERIREHCSGVTGGFTRKYGVYTLVYVEAYGSVAEAIGREKRLKEWRRAWKIELIEKVNPMWEDLYPEYERTGMGLIERLSGLREAQRKGC